MLGVRLDKNITERLNNLCRHTGHNKSYYAKRALNEFLDKREDYLLGIAALEKREPTVSLKALEKLLDLEN